MNSLMEIDDETYRDNNNNNNNRGKNFEFIQPTKDGRKGGGWGWGEIFLLFCEMTLIDFNILE